MRADARTRCQGTTGYVPLHPTAAVDPRRVVRAGAHITTLPVIPKGKLEATEREELPSLEAKSPPPGALNSQHSFKGGCLEVARQAPQRVGRMALIAPMGFGRVRPIGAAAVTAVRVWLKIAGRPLPYPKLDIPAGEPEIWRLEEVLAPTLLLWGQRDLYFPPSYGRRAAKVLPNARLDIFPHHGHAPHREAPEEFNRQVLDFFAET